MLIENKIDKYLREAGASTAYWISPRGQVVPVGITHIDAIIKNPKAFGLTTDYINSTYERYGEKVGIEGKAREEIILKVIEKGWIRVRRYNNQGYSLNINKMTKKVKDVLFDWANKLLNTGIGGVKERDKYIPVNIQGLKDHFMKNLTIQDVANDALFEGEERFDPENAVVIVESIMDV